MSETVLPVRGSSPYDVVIGRGIFHHLVPMLGEAVERVAVICPERLEAFVDDLLEDVPEDLEIVMLAIPEGEEAKQYEVAAGCWDALGESGFTRSDAVVTLGGGATTDLGGFVAATWLRGVRVIHVPTTLLAMVDAAVGGKTGINTEAGKNLVGAFHEPSGVICDLAMLDTLDRDELIAGLAEVVKCGFIADPEILRLIEENDPASLVASSSVLRELIERAITVKIDVVVEDLKETGGSGGHPGREALNYGHTLGHAIERNEDYAIRHGEAVAVGCVFAAELGAQAGSLSRAVVDRHRAILERVGLPTGFEGVPYEHLRDLMAMDKKTRGNTLRFVILDDVAQPRILNGPSESDLRAAFSAVSNG